MLVFELEKKHFILLFVILDFANTEITYNEKIPSADRSITQDVAIARRHHNILQLTSA